jgi:hypothetical protein
MRDDRAGRGDRQLLARDLEDERPEGVERWELVLPCAGTEVRTRVDQPCQNRVRVAEELPSLAVGERGAPARSLMP